MEKLDLCVSPQIKLRVCKCNLLKVVTNLEESQYKKPMVKDFIFSVPEMQLNSSNCFIYL